MESNLPKLYYNLKKSQLLRKVGYHTHTHTKQHKVDQVVLKFLLSVVN